MSGRPKKELRHKAEMKMVAIAVVWSWIAIIAVSILAINHESIPGWLKSVLGILILTPFVTAVLLRLKYWQTIADAVEVTPEQFPDIHKIFKDSARRIGLDELPHLYIINSMGAQNAYAVKRGYSKKYIVLYSDLADVYSELGKKNEDMLRFILSHELGHVYMGHTNIRRMIMQNILKPLFLQKSFSRAQEYTADRVAASVNKQGTYAQALFPIYAGKRQWQHASLKTYLEHDSKEISRFWMAITNFMADHPVGRRRLATLNQMNKEGWQHVHGSML